jgi:hypothetical protein
MVFSAKAREAKAPQAGFIRVRAAKERLLAEQSMSVLC